MTQARVLALLAGKAVPFANGESSAIAKWYLDGPVEIGLLGIIDDEQADPRYHGGPDKALHLYPQDHYARWQAEAPGHPLLNLAGAFGENIASTGLTEDQVCIGDRFRLGSALIEISQGREPCWKLAHRMDWPKLPKLIVKEGLCGWYFRVIEPGTASAGDDLVLVDRPYPQWNVLRVFMAVVARAPEPELAAIASLPPLFGGWREHATFLMNYAKTRGTAS
jgi:MOSC domain-containing protein YiiM